MKEFILTQPYTTIEEMVNSGELSVYKEELQQGNIEKYAIVSRIGNRYDIEGKKIELHAKAGSSGKLFGSVTSKEVTEALNKMLGTKIDKKKLTVADIKNFGEYTATVKLFTDISASFTVVVSSAE